MKDSKEVAASYVRGEVHLVGLFTDDDVVAGECLDGYHGAFLRGTPDEVRLLGRHAGSRVCVLSPEELAALLDDARAEERTACLTCCAAADCGNPDAWKAITGIAEAIRARGDK